MLENKWIKGIMVGSLFGGILTVPFIDYLISDKGLAILVGQAVGGFLALLVTERRE